LKGDKYKTRKKEKKNYKQNKILYDGIYIPTNHGLKYKWDKYRERK